MILSETFRSLKSSHFTISLYNVTYLHFVFYVDAFYLLYLVRVVHYWQFIAKIWVSLAPPGYWMDYLYLEFVYGATY